MEDDIPSSNDILLEISKERYSNLHSDGFKRERFIFDFNPSDFKNFVENEQDLISRLGRKWKVNLALLGSLASEYQPITSNYLKKDKDGENHPVSLLHISTSSRNLTDIFGVVSKSSNRKDAKSSSRKKVSKVLKLAMKVGLIQCVSRKYRFNSRVSCFNFSRCFAWNKVVESLVLKTCFKFHLNISYHLDSHTICELFDSDIKIDPEKYFNITLKTRRIGVANCTDEEAVNIISRKYSDLLRPRLEKIEAMNHELPNELKIRFEPNVKRDSHGFIKRIGLRATNKIVSLKEHENEHPEYQGKWRKEYLNEHFNTKKWIAYDVHASIYQISHLLNFGEWIGNEKDPYEMMFGEKFKTREDREAYKSMCMPLYFDNTKEILNHNRLRLPVSISRYEDWGIVPVLVNAEESMHRFTGEKFYNEIFLHESLLYIDFVCDLRRRGIDVVQVYDGFYMRDGVISIEELEALMKECAMKYKGDYDQWMTNTILAA